MITKQNIEEYILMHVDQELSTDESAALLNFLEQYPEYKVMLADYEATVLPIDEAIVFPDKDKLYKAEAPAILVLPMVNTKAKWWKVTAVAAAIVIVCFGANTFFGRKIIEDRNTEVSTIAANKSIVPPPNELTNIANATEKHKPQTNPTIAKRVNNNISTEANSVTATPHVELPIEEVEILEVLVNKRLVIVSSKQQLQSNFSKPALPENNHNSNIVSNTIINNPLLEDLRTQVKEKISDIKEVSEAIKYASISLSLGNKNVIIKNK